MLGNLSTDIDYSLLPRNTYGEMIKLERNKQRDIEVLLVSPDGAEEKLY